MNKTSFLSVLLLTLLAMPLVVSAHCAGRHSGGHPHCGGEEPPPPPPPPESCANAAGEFPGFAYVRMLYGGKHGGMSGSELHLADTTGTCSIKIFTVDSSERLNITYRQNGDEGRIMWEQGQEENLKRKSDLVGPIVKLLEFTVTTGEVSDVSHTVAWRHHNQVPDANSVSYVTLSPDGDTAYFGINESNDNNSLHSIDLSAGCNTECDSELVPGSVGNDYYGQIAMGTSPDRVYFTNNNIGLSFIDLTTGTIRHIHKVDPNEPDFPEPYALSVGQLSSGQEAVAVNYNFLGIDIIDVETCYADGQSADCLSTGESEVIRAGIPGITSTFFSAPWLLVSNEGNIDIVNIDTGVITEGYVEGDVGTFDSAE